jgi:hypothetical protein
MAIALPANQSTQVPFARYHVFISDVEGVYYVQKRDLNEGNVSFGQKLVLTLVK